MTRSGYQGVTISDGLAEEIDAFILADNPDLNSRPKVIKKAIECMQLRCDCGQPKKKTSTCK